MGRYEKFFNQIAQDLDLTDTEYNTIVGSYEAVGNFLTNSNELKKYNPEVFPQGSVRLGTVVKPLKKDDYDVDLVCELNASYLPAKDVKNNVGNVLKNSRYYKQLEEEHGRCWTLDYDANPPYHLDILPGVSLPNDRIKATNYIDNEYKWLYTNPKGFAKWFLSLKKPTVNERFNDSVEPIKEYAGKTVLQRAVQIIKRHRDVYFKDNPDDGPASVIITALTGLSYNSESTIEDILKNGPIQWISHIGYKGDKLSIKIPSLPDDDYADKWSEEGDKPVKNFLEWHQQLIYDLDNMFKESKCFSPEYLEKIICMYGSKQMEFIYLNSCYSKKFVKKILVNNCKNYILYHLGYEGENNDRQAIKFSEKFYTNLAVHNQTIDHTFNDVYNNFPNVMVSCEGSKINYKDNLFFV